MNVNVLFVDDEPAVLDGYQRLLQKDFQIRTACGGEQALAEMGKAGPYAAVISDMRMPGMNGVEFLAQVRNLAPHTIRVVLTGHADLDMAINAVNEGAVFRFLTKPCAAEVLRKTLTACLMQYRLVTAEKELLEDTLMGSLKVLADVLGLASPLAFGRSLRIKRYVQHMVRELRLEVPWRYEAAAMLSQLGCVTLEPELLEAAYSGTGLSPEEKVHFNMHPAVARDLLANIPRLEGIAWIIGQQLGVGYVDSDASDSIKTGAVILQIAIAFDDLKIRGLSDQQALAELQASRKFDARVLQTLEHLPPLARQLEAKTIEVSHLEPGMIIDEEVRSNLGLLLAGKGQEVNHPLAARLRSFHRRGGIKDKIAVLAAGKALGAAVNR